MGYLEKYRIFAPELRRSLHIAKYRNEQKSARFHIVTYIIKANAQLLDFQSKSKLERVRAYNMFVCEKADKLNEQKPINNKDLKLLPLLLKLIFVFLIHLHYIKFNYFLRSLIWPEDMPPISLRLLLVYVVFIVMISIILMVKH